MSGGDDLTLLRECGDPVEVSTLSSLLDGHGVEYVVQGEHHSGMIGGLVVHARILVKQADLVRARTLIESEPVISGVEPGERSLEGGLCPVHEQQAIAICDKCGTFLCASCNALGNPPLCEDCSKRDDVALAERARGTEKMRRGVVFFMLGAGALVLAFPVIRALLKWLHPTH